MIDAPLRRMLDRPLTTVASILDRPWVSPDRITVVGLTAGIASAGAAAVQWWPLAFALWMLSRVLDGLDGALARRRRSAAVMSAAAGPAAAAASGSAVGGANGSPASVATGEAGGYLDIVCDFVIYGAVVVGVAIGVANGFGAPWWPFLLVMLTYYVNGAAFLAFSSIAERTGRTLDDGRSLSFLGRIAEGTETIVVHSLWLLFPVIAWQLAIVWAAFVGISAVQRIVVGYRSLR